MAFFDSFFAYLRAFLGESLERSLRRRLRAASPASIAELREGLHCRIAGIVRPLDQATLTAPISGQPCVAYLLEVVEHSTTAVGVQRDLVIYDRKAVPFLLVDGEHRAVIDPSHAQILLSADHVVSAGSPLELDRRAREALERYLPGRNWDRTTRLRIHERLVDIGERISIAGTGHREADPQSGGERGYRDHIQDRLRFAGTAQLPLLIGADPP